METIEFAPGVQLHIHPTSQFKDVTIRVSLLSKGNRNDRAVRMILDFLLSDVCAAYPTKDDAQRISDLLYGATFSARTSSRGNADLLQFTCTCVEGSYVNEDLFPSQVAFMKEFMFHPYFVNGRFESHLFEESKSRARMLVECFLEQPAEATLEAAFCAYSGTYQEKALPRVEEIDAVLNEDCVEVYERILKEATCDLFVLGNVQVETCTKLLREAFPFTPRPTMRQFVIRNESSGLQEVETTVNDEQSVLVLLFDTHCVYTDPQESAFMLGNGILGGLSTSFLFQEVREANGYCYSVSSENEPYDGILILSAEVEPGREAECEACMLAQLTRLQQGDFDQALLDTTRSMYADSWIASQDGVRSLIWDDYRSVLLGKPDTIEDRIAQFAKVTRQDVIDAFQNVELRVISRRIARKETQ